jgi:hypothetical protein
MHIIVLAEIVKLNQVTQIIWALHVDFVYNWKSIEDLVCVITTVIAWETVVNNGQTTSR